MRRKIIALDLDDVIVNTGPMLIDYYNRMYGTSLKYEDLYSLDLKKWGVTKAKTALRRADEFLKTKEFEMVAPESATVEAVKRLASRFDLYIVTSREQFLETVTQQMLDTYFRGIFRSVFFCDIYRYTERSKADVCKELKADIFIDDNLNHVLEVAREVGIKVLLFGDYPWNRSSAVLPANVLRVGDWQAVEERLHAES